MKHTKTTWCIRTIKAKINTRLKKNNKKVLRTVNFENIVSVRVIKFKYVKYVRSSNGTLNSTAELQQQATAVGI